jgi:hypothetical protein
LQMYARFSASCYRPLMRSSRALIAQSSGHKPKI